MNHIVEDTVIKFVLDLLDEDEVALIKKHIRGCDKCKSTINKVQSDIDLISSFNPKTEEADFRMKTKNRTFYTWLKSAAVLILGFVFGYLTSTLSQSEQINVVEQNLVTRTPQVYSLQFTLCSNVDIW